MQRGTAAGSNDLLDRPKGASGLLGVGEYPHGTSAICGKTSMN